MTEIDRLVTHLNEEFKKISNSINHEILKINPKLYHYTDYEGLKNILSSRTLRLTDYRYLNDKTEIRYGQKILKDFILRSDIPDREDIWEITDKYINDLNQKLKIYIFSFSRNRYKLSLWRYYAQNGTGFSIGFKDYFKNIKPEGSIIENPVLGEVYYEEDETEKILNKFLPIYKNILNEGSRTLKSYDERKFLYQYVNSKLMTILIELSPFIKDKSFKDEEEIRIIRYDGIPDPENMAPQYLENIARDSIPSTPSEIPFVTATQGPKPVIFLDKFDHSDISDIIIGPCCNFIEAKSAIENLLFHLGYNINDINIEQASLPIQHTGK